MNVEYVKEEQPFHADNTRSIGMLTRRLQDSEMRW